MPTRKILFISARSDTGGGPKALNDLAVGLSSTHNIYIASPCEEPFFSKFKNISIKHFYIPHRRFSLIKALQLVTFCKTNSINTVHSHGFGAGLYSRFISLFGITSFHTFHGIDTTNSRKIFFESLIENFLKFVTFKYIAVSKSEKNKAIHVLKLSENQITVIFNIFSQENEKEEEEEKKSATKVRLGTFSRFDPIKNLELLILEFQTLPVDEYTLIIGGPGTEENLKHISKQDNIFFYGEVKNKSHFFSKIDIFCSFSLSEGLPFTVLEALSYKRNCILSKIDSHLELHEMYPNYITFHNNKLIPEHIKISNHIDANFDSFSESKVTQQIKSLYSESEKFC